MAINCGANPLAYALSREEDISRTWRKRPERFTRSSPATDKEGYPLFRKQSHPKSLNDEIGGWVNRLILENQANRDQQGWPEGCAFPLFRRFEADQERLGGPASDVRHAH